MRTNRTTLAGFLLAASLLFPALAAARPNEYPAVKNVEVKGYVGERISDCIARRVKGQDVNELVEPFRHRTESRLWQSEFWGKWMLGAISSYEYTHDWELYEKISEAASLLMETQSPDGYIGNYSPEHQLQEWDVWGRKYTALGLLAWYDLSGDRRALKAARRLIDHLMTQVGEGKTDIVATGNYRGMASSSILEAVVSLYRHTGDPSYLDFARYIVRQWETPEGPELISKAIAGIPVASRFPHPEKWFSRENGQKAYEMMSCYEGLLELYKIDGDPTCLSAIEKTVASIINDEINIAGSGSSFECWYGGKPRQYLPTYHTMETCVTFTWMQLCFRLLRHTRDSSYGDLIERAMYNALMASLKDDASQIAKYSPLEGWRSEGEEQCGMHINCCNANGPRAFSMIPKVMYDVDGRCIHVNLYAPSEADIILTQKERLHLRQTTDYPVSDLIKIEIDTPRPVRCAIAVRIPGWSENVSVAVNGEEIKDIIQGHYLTLEREWKSGDSIHVRLDLRGRVVREADCLAIVRGPVVLSRDSRFNDGFVDEAVALVSGDGFVELTPLESHDFSWMAFSVPMHVGTLLEHNRSPRLVHLCDFASAGNTWDRSLRYRVWLPQTLNVMNNEYIPY